MEIKNRLASTLIIISLISTLAIPFLSAKPKWIETLTLEYSDDCGVNWHKIDGNPSRGFTLKLDPSKGHGFYYFIDIGNIEPSPDYSDVDTNPFYLKTAPRGRLLKYWDQHGVNPRALPGSHQEHLWKIINGEKPMFYLISGENDVWIIDGFYYDYFEEETNLRVNADYPFGIYHFVGTVIVDGEPHDTMVKIHFTN